MRLSWRTDSVLLSLLGILFCLIDFTIGMSALLLSSAGGVGRWWSWPWSWWRRAVVVVVSCFLVGSHPNADGLQHIPSGGVLSRT